MGGQRAAEVVEAVGETDDVGGIEGFDAAGEVEAGGDPEGVDVVGVEAELGGVAEGALELFPAAAEGSDGELAEVGLALGGEREGPERRDAEDGGVDVGDGSEGVPADVAQRALDLAASKLPLKTKFVRRDQED